MPFRRRLLVDRQSSQQTAVRFWRRRRMNRRSAARSTKSCSADDERPAPRSTVVESQGRMWVYTIADKDWQPRSGKRVAVVGPLSVLTGRQYTARYMEAMFEPGMRTAVHRHSGAEAWYLLTGTQCLETP